MDLYNLYKFLRSATNCRDIACFDCKQDYVSNTCPLMDKSLVDNTREFCEALRKYIDKRNNTQILSDQEIEEFFKLIDQ